VIVAYCLILSSKSSELLQVISKAFSYIIQNKESQKKHVKAKPHPASFETSLSPLGREF
jgi:hypothetical protein